MKMYSSSSGGIVSAVLSLSEVVSSICEKGKVTFRDYTGGRGPLNIR
jgi:hypothetical protein